MLLFLFRCSYIPRSCFSSNFLSLMFMFILHFVSLWYIFVYLLMWFFFVRLFFSYSSSFFFLILLHSFSFFKKLFPICSWCLTLFYNSFIYSFIYVLPQIHENLLSIIGGQSFWRHSCLVYVKQKVTYSSRLYQSWFQNYENHLLFPASFVNWRLYWSITTSNYEIKEFRSAISSLNAHQRDASVWRKQKILKSLLLWKISMVCFVKWYERLTISQARTRMTISWDRKRRQQHRCSALWNLWRTVSAW